MVGSDEQNHTNDIKCPAGEVPRDNENQPKATEEAAKKFKHDHIKGVDLCTFEPLRVGVDIDRCGRGAVRLALVTLRRKNSESFEGRTYALWHMRDHDHASFTPRLCPEGELPSRCARDWLNIQGYSRTVKQWRLNKEWLVSSRRERNRRLVEVANLLIDGDREAYSIEEVVDMRKPLITRKAAKNPRKLGAFSPKPPNPEIDPNREEESTRTQLLPLSPKKVAENNKETDASKEKQPEIHTEAGARSHSSIPPPSATTTVYDLTGDDDSVVPIKVEHSTFPQSELPYDMPADVPADAPVDAPTKEDLQYQLTMSRLKRKEAQLEREELEVERKLKRFKHT